MSATSDTTDSPRARAHLHPHTARAAGRPGRPHLQWLAVALLGAASAGLGHPASAAAQGNWRDQVSRQISNSSIVSALRNDGYAVSHGPFYELVDRGSRQSLRLTLEAGRTYKAVGKCDHDCSDLDFRLYDENGRLVDSDIGSDDIPVVTVTPGWTGTFRLEVEMHACSTPTCGWGVAVFGSNGGGGRSTTGTRVVSYPSPAPTPAPANSWRDQVRALLASSNLIRGYRSEGYAESHATLYGLVESGGRQSMTVRLEAGRSYRIVGKCDHDCSDLDFRLYDEHGTLADSDLGADDVPAVAVTPHRTAAFRLEVTMAACSTRSCGWGASVLVR